VNAGKRKRVGDHPSTLELSTAPDLDRAAEPAPPARTEGEIPADVWSVSITSLFSDWSYEMVLGILPFFLSFTLGASPFLVGFVSGAADFFQSGAQNLAGGRWASGPQRKLRGTLGYLTTTVSNGLIALAAIWPEVLVLRVSAWIGRGSRQPIKKAIVANATSSQNQGLAFGLEQAMDSLGAVLGTASAIGIILYGGIKEFREDFAISIVPGLIAVACFYLLVKDRHASAASPNAPRHRSPWGALPARFRLFLLAEAVFGLGYFSILLALLRVGLDLLPSAGGSFSEVVITALLLYLLYNLIFAGLSYPAGRWADRIPGVGLIALSFLLFAVVDVLLLGYGGLVAGVLAFLVAGVQVALQGVSESAWIGRQMPPDSVASAFGWLGSVQGFAILAGTLMIGALWTYVSAPLAFGVSATLSVAGALLLLPLVASTHSPSQGVPAPTP